jgi:nicotinate-nucleotide pyrophosphorylase (carboxylating)
MTDNATLAPVDAGTIPPHALHRVIDIALEEDAPWGDITSETLVPADATATATLAAREPGILSGGGVFVAVMARVDPSISATVHVADGSPFVAGDVLASVTGTARSVLRAERVALNLVQRMSGIATATARYVDAVAGTDARIVDTRKTTPGLRALERYAVRCGGGHNHRTSLSDAVLAKDNHLAVLAARGIPIGDAIRDARQRLGHTVHLEVEVDRIDQIEPVVSAGVDTIMLDNFTPAMLVDGVRIVAGRALVEASGGVNLDTVAAIAATGVDIISVGALTHSARALDLGLDIAVSDTLVSDTPA